MATELVLVSSVALLLFVGSSLGEEIKCGQRFEPDVDSHFDDNGITRIVNGTEVWPGEVPFQVSWRYRGSHECGGVIVGERTILTAAHCVDDRWLERFEVFVGSHNQSNLGVGQRLGIAEVIIHEKESIHDIALIKTKQTIAWNLTPNGYGSINRICMPSKHEHNYDDGQTVWVSGWGDINLNTPDILNIVDLQIADNRCRKLGTIINDGQFCMMSDKYKGWSFGDSGGPIFIRRHNSDRAVLVGLVKGHKEFPTRYIGTRVSYYLDWIAEKCPNCNFSLYDSIQ